MKIKNILIYIYLPGLLMTACKAHIKKGDELAAPSAVNFTITRYIDPATPNDSNTYIFRNTTEGAFISAWDFGALGKSRASVDTIFFASAGTYTINLKSTTPGGSGSVTKDLVILKDSPYKPDFSITQGADPYHFIITATTSVISSYFKLPNGEVDSALTTTVYMPFNGTFNVSFVATTVKGSSETTKPLTVTASDDASNPDLTDPIFALLTGGPSDLDGKTWLLALPTEFSTGVGPYIANAISVAYYNYPAKDGGYGDAWKNGGGANEYTFIFNKYQYVPKNQKVTVHYAWAETDFGKPFVLYNDLALTDPNHKAAPFILKNEGIGITGYTLTFGDKSYMSYMDGRRHYEIAKIQSDSMWVRHKYNDDPKANPANDGNQRVMLYVAK